MLINKIVTRWSVAHAATSQAKGGRGVALEGTKKGGAHSPIPKIILKTSIRPYDNNLFLKKIFP